MGVLKSIPKHTKYRIKCIQNTKDENPDFEHDE
jgi:hypothetical protein